MTKRRSTSGSKKSTGLMCTVKRRGHLEKYDERKVYGSVYAACCSAHIKHREAEKIASHVCSVITSFIKKKKTVTADILFRKVAVELRKVDDDAGFMYATHRDIS